MAARRLLTFRLRLALVRAFSNVFVLAVGLLGMFLYFRNTTQDEAVQRLSSLAAVMAETSQAALVFDDPRAAEEILRTLRLYPEVDAAWLLDAKGRHFAAYHAQVTHTLLLPFGLENAGHGFVDGHLVLVRSVGSAEAPVGKIFLQEELTSVQKRVSSFGAAGVALGVGCTALALLLAGWAQGRVTGPILRVAEAAITVASQKDYSLRVPKPSEDEVGDLTTAFNDMLAEIQTRDQALLAAKQELEHHLDDLRQEVTERKQAEAELASSVSLLQATLESTTDGILVVDRQGKIVQLNGRFLELWRIPNEVVATRDDDRALAFVLDQLVDPEAFLAKVKELYAQPEAESFDELVFRDGRIFERYSRPRRDASGIAGRVWSFRDVTDRRRAAEALRESEHRLRQVQKMEAIGSLAGGVAHDFNNLLQAMLSHIQVLRAGHPDSTRVTGVVAELEQQVRRGAGLARQLLLFSRKETTHFESLDLNQVVRGAIDLLRRLVREDVSFILELAPEELGVDADGGQLDQVLMNLAVNASDAMPAGGRLTFRTGAEGNERVWFEVEDTGHGIPDEIRERIFEPFFTTKDASRGTGLGLAVVHGIVTGHNGHIEVRSAVGGGTTFRVVLARRAGPLPTRHDAIEGAGAVATSLAGQRILVVEDEPAAREGLVQILDLLGLAATGVGSGEEALATPGEPSFDLLLTDFLLPGINGLELSKRLVERWPSLKVIVMSGYAEDKAMRQGVGDGKLNFLQKPFDLAGLSHALEGILAD